MDKDDNEMQDPKVDNVEEDQSSVISKKKKNEKDDASVTSTKKWHRRKSRETKGNINEKSNASITSTEKKVDTVDKTKISQKSPEAVVTSKNNKNYTVDKSDK